MDWSRVELKSVGGLLLKNGYHYSVVPGTLEYDMYDVVLTFEHEYYVQQGNMHVVPTTMVDRVIVSSSEVIGIEIPALEGAHA